MSKDNRELIKLIHNDKKLDRDLKMTYASMANLFLDDFKDNLNLTSIDLNEKYKEISIDLWKDFLTVPVVNKYIQSFKVEQMSVRADEGLMSGNKDAVSLKKAIESKGPIVNNTNLILIRVPEKVDFNENEDLIIEGI